MVLNMTNILLMITFDTFMYVKHILKLQIEVQKAQNTFEP